MGFFDRAKEAVAGRFGDELVRKGDFDERESEESEEELEEPEEHHEPKPRREKRAIWSRQPKRSEEENQKEIDLQSEEESYEFPSDEPSPKRSRERQPINQKEFSELSESEGQSPKEILQSMGIQETFTIGSDILFLDAELADQSFSTQAPYGYDMGEVDFFLTKVQRSIAEYVRLARIRNDDVWKLAGNLSEVLVEINNLRFNSEIANGINVIAGGGDEDAMALDLQEARVKARKLQKELDELYAGGASRVEDIDFIESLQNDLSLERRAREKAESEARDLRAHLLEIEEEHNIQIFSDSEEMGGGPGFGESNQGEFQSVSDWDDKPQRELYEEESSYEQVGRDHWLPEEEDESLPSGDFQGGFDFASEDEEEVPLDSIDGEFEEESLEEIPLESFEDSENGGFSEASYGDSAFSQDPYQNIDEFIQDNFDAFPEDNATSAAELREDFDDPDEDGPHYGFERNL